MRQVTISCITSDLTEQARKLLTENGCRLIPAGDKKTIVVYPLGTYKVDMKTLDLSEKYRVYFDNGFTLQEEVKIVDIGKVSYLSLYTRR